MQNTSTINTELQNTKCNPTFNKRIRTTNYIVGIHFSTTAKESVNDKVLRLIKSDISKSGKSNYR